MLFFFSIAFSATQTDGALKADMENRNADYENVVNGYYDGATELYEWGWGTCFHFSRFYKGESFNQSVCPKPSEIHDFFLIFIIDRTS
jgi:hypothetical protein